MCNFRTKKKTAVNNTFQIEISKSLIVVISQKNGNPEKKI